MRALWWWVAGLAACLGSAGCRRAEACTPPRPPADARPEPYFLLDYRDVDPFVSGGSTAGAEYPTNMVFRVTYAANRAPVDFVPAWLGSIKVRTSTGQDLPIVVDALAGGTSFRVAPEATWPAGARIQFLDRFVSVPCGEPGTPCVEGDGPPFAELQIGQAPDVTKPSLAGATVTYGAWRTYAGVETCMNTLCAGYTISATFTPATDADTPQAGILYRINGADAYQLFAWSASMECPTGCFHLPGMPGPPTTPPQPVTLTAVDWLGHESAEHLTITFPPPPSCAELGALLDAGPPDAPVPDARPPDAPVALPDAPATTSSSGSASCGCATAGPGGLAPAVLVLAALLRRPRRKASPSSPGRS